MKFLHTGGAGYLGSNTFAAHREAGFEPEILDDFCNSSPVVLERGDVLDPPWVETVLRRHQPASAVHIAGDKAEVKSP